MEYLVVITSEQFQKNFIIKVIRDNKGRISVLELKKALLKRFNCSCLEICSQQEVEEYKKNGFLVYEIHNGKVF